MEEVWRIGWIAGCETQTHLDGITGDRVLTLKGSFLDRGDHLSLLSILTAFSFTSPIFSKEYSVVPSKATSFRRFLCWRTYQRREELVQKPDQWTHHFSTHFALHDHFFRIEIWTQRRRWRRAEKHFMSTHQYGIETVARMVWIELECSWQQYWLDHRWRLECNRKVSDEETVSN